MPTSPRPCKAPGCPLPAAPRVQWCYEDWLAKRLPIDRVRAAERRLSLIPEEARLPRVKASECPPGRRWCAGCQTMVRTKDCTGSRCKACSSIASHTARMKSDFGIDAMTYQALFERQGGKCAICRGAPKTARLAVDHDHSCCPKGQPSCGKCVRGLLCSRCNHELLGAAHDSAQVLINALEYLTRPPSTGEWVLPPKEVADWRERYGPDAGQPAPY